MINRAQKLLEQPLEPPSLTWASPLEPLCHAEHRKVPHLHHTGIISAPKTVGATFGAAILDMGIPFGATFAKWSITWCRTNLTMENDGEPAWQGQLLEPTNLEREHPLGLKRSHKLWEEHPQVPHLSRKLLAPPLSHHSWFTIRGSIFGCTKTNKSTHGRSPK